MGVGMKKKPKMTNSKKLKTDKKVPKISKAEDKTIVQTDPQQMKKKRKKEKGDADVSAKRPKLDNPEAEKTSKKKSKPDNPDAPKPSTKKTNLDPEFSLLDRLHGADPLAALHDLDLLLKSEEEETVDATLTSFIDQGGSARDVLTLLETEVKVKSADVTIIFGAIESLLKCLAKRIRSMPGEGEEAEMARKPSLQLALDITRIILEDHIRYVMMQLSPSNTAHQVRKCLGLMTSMVSCGPQIAKEILLKLDFGHGSFESLVGRQMSAEIREAFIRFFLSFLQHSDSGGIMRIYMDKCKSKLATIFSRICQDPIDLILFILETLRDRLVKSWCISKTEKMKLFSVPSLKPILQLCSKWKPDEKLELDKEEEEISIQRVRDAARDLFEALLTSHKLGVVFYDASGGTSGQNQNHLLQNLLRAMENSWENQHLSEIVIFSLSANPDQFKPFCQKVLQPLWQPRTTQTWRDVSNLLIGIVESFQLQTILQDATKRPNFTKLSAAIVKNIFCSDVMYKEVVIPAIENSAADHSISRQGIRLLHVLLNKIGEILEMKIFDGADNAQIVLSTIKSRIPTVSSLVKFWQSEIEILTTKGCEGGESLASLLHTAKTLHFYMAYFPQKFTQDLNIQDLLQATQNLFTTLELQNFREESDSILLFLLKVLSLSSAQEANPSYDPDNIRVLVKIAGQDRIVENSLLALKTLKSVFKLGDKSYDALRIWFHSIPIKSREKISEKITLSLSKSSSLQEEVEQLNSKYGTILDHCQLALIRCSLLRKKFPDYYLGCLRCVATLQEDPTKFANLLAKEENLNEFCDAENIFEESNEISENFCDFKATLRAIQSWSAYRLGKMKAKELNEIFCSCTQIESAAFKILGHDSVYNAFDPFGKETETNGIILDLLEWNRDGTVSRKYAEKIFDLIESDLDRVQGDAEFLLFDRALKLMHSASEKVTPLLRLIVDTVELNESFGQGFAFCKVMAGLLEIHDKRFMTTMSDAKCQKFFSRVVELVLKQEIPHPIHSRFMNAIADHFVVDHQFWRAFYPGDFIVLCSTSKLKESEALLKHLVMADAKCAKDFLKWSHKHFQTIERDIFKFLPSLAAALNSKKNFKHAKTLVQKIAEILMDETTQDLTKDSSDLLLNLMSKNEIQVPLSVKNDDGLSANPHRLAILLAATKNAENFDKDLVRKIFVHSLEMIPKNLKEFSKDSQNKSLLESIEAFCRLASDCSKCVDASFKEDSELWQNFVRACLKFGLKLKLNETIGVLSDLVQRRFTDDKSNVEINQIYEMVCGHSNFVETILSTSNKEVDKRMKSKVLNLILSLIRCKGGLISSAQLPLFLGAYRASLSEVDELLLKIIYEHDFPFQDGIPLQAYKPLLWGDAAISKYSHASSAPNGKVSQLSKIPKTSEVLGLIDVNRMVETSIKFPLNLTLNLSGRSSTATEEAGGGREKDSLYDPRFFLHLFAQICSTENYVDRHLKLIESGVLGLAFASLSSMDKMMRGLGATLISRIYVQLESARKSLSAEKQVWLHLINVLKNGLAESLLKRNEEEQQEKIEVGAIPRIPCILSAFLVRTCMILHNPLDPMYKAITSFLLAKPMLAIYSIPEFLRLFHSKDPLQFDIEREWIVSVLKDGIRDDLSYSLMQQAFVFKMIQSFHDSSLGSLPGPDVVEETDETSKTNLLILNVVHNTMKLKKAAFDMVRNRGLLVWVLGQTLVSDKLNPILVEIVCQAWRSVQNDHLTESGQRLPPSMLLQFLQTSHRLLSILDLAFEKHNAFEVAHKLLQVLCDVVAYLVSNDDTNLLIPNHFGSRVEPLMTNLLKRVGEDGRLSYDTLKQVFKLHQRLLALSSTQIK